MALGNSRIIPPSSMHRKSSKNNISSASLAISARRKMWNNNKNNFKRGVFLSPSYYVQPFNEKDAVIPFSQNTDLVAGSILTTSTTTGSSATELLHRRRLTIDSEQPDFYLFQPYSSDYIAFGFSMSASSDFFGWSQNRYGWATNNPNDVSDITSYTVAQYENDLSSSVEEVRKNNVAKAYYDYLTSVYNDKVLWAGGRGAMVVKFTADTTYFRRHRISKHGQALKNIDLRILSCAMGTNYFVLGGYTFPPNNEATQIVRSVQIYRFNSGGNFELEKTITYDHTVPKAAESVAAADGAFFIGDPGERTVRGYLQNAAGDNWTPSLMMMFGGKGESSTSDGESFGSSMAYVTGMLAVGAPTSVPHVDHVPNQPDNAGSVFVYRIVITSSSLTAELIVGINAPSNYLQEHYVQSSGLMFGASVALSQKMADNEVYLFVGAPGSVGSQITRASGFRFDGGGGALVTFSLVVPDEGAGRSTFTHWFTGFIGQADHDVGASVAYSHEKSMLFYGAPLATNWPGSNDLYGSGRVYIAAFCKRNEESYSYLPNQQYLRRCRACAPGYYSKGGRERCASCSGHANAPGVKPNKGEWLSDQTCVWRCKAKYFGPSCLECSQYSTSINEHLPPHAHWTSGESTCKWVCDEGYPLSSTNNACELPDPPSPPANVRLSSSTSSTAEIRWQNPTHDSRVVLSSFDIQVEDSSSGLTTTYNIDISSTTSSLEGPLAALAPSGETGVWWKWSLSDLLASTTYNAKVRAHIFAGIGSFSSASNNILTSTMTAPSPPTNLTYVRSTGGSVTVVINRPSDMGGTTLDKISFSAEVCEARSSGNCLDDTTTRLQTVVVTVASLMYGKYVTVDVNGLFANHAYRIRFRAISGSSLTSMEWSDSIVCNTSPHPTAPSVMQPPVVNQATSDTLHVEWHPPYSNGGSSLIGYRIYIYEAYDNDHHGMNGTDFAKLVLHTNIAAPYEKILTGLTARRKYSITIAAYNDANQVGHQSPMSVPIFTQAPTAPTIPRNPVFIEVGSSWFSVQWKIPVDMGGAIATKYKIKLRQYIGTASSVITYDNIQPEGPDAFGLFRYRMSNLKAETSYDFSVSVSNIVGDSPFTQPSEAKKTNPVRIPSVPGVPFAESSGSDFVVVKWPAPEDDGGSPIETYAIYVSEDGAQWSSTTFATTTSTTYRFVNVRALSVRWVYVKAINMAGTGEASSVSSPLKADDAGTPGSPTSLSLLSTTATTLELTWVPPLSDGGTSLFEYLLRVTTVTGQFVKEIKVQVPTVTGTVIGLQVGTAYTVTCAALNNAGHAGAAFHLSPVSTLASPTAPSKPTEVHVIGESLSLIWSPPDDSGGAVRTKYIVSYAPTDRQSENVWSSGYDIAASVDTLELSLLNMPPTSSAYDLRIAAWNSLGAGGWSNPLVTVVPGLVLSNLGYGTERTATSLRVTWTRPPNAAAVHVIVKSFAADGSKESTTFISRESDGTTLTNLFAGTEYTLSAFASTSEHQETACATCNGPISTWPSTKVTLEASVPTPPQNVRLTSAYSTSLTLEWDVPVSVGGARNVTYYGGCYMTGNEGATGSVQDADGSGSLLVLTAHRLHPNVDYNCYVITRTEAGVSERQFTSSYVRTLSPSVTSAPSRPVIVDVQSGSVTMRFSPPSSDGGIPSYVYTFEHSQNGILFREMAASDYHLEIDTASDPNTVTVNIKRLLALTRYYFRVSAQNTKGVSLPSLPTHAAQTAASTAPSSPTDLTATLNSVASTVTLRWSEPTLYGGVRDIKYTVERNLLGLYGDACSIASTIPGYDDDTKSSGLSVNYDTLNQNDLPTFARVPAISETNYEVVGGDLTSMAALREVTAPLGEKYSALYVYRIRATNSVGGGGYSVKRLIITPVKTTLTPAAPIYVQETYNSVQSPNDVLLSWSQPSVRGCSPHSYILLRYPKFAASRDKTGTPWDEPPVRIDVGSKTVYRDSGLAHTTSYRWQLIAINVVGESEPSAHSLVITTGKAKPSEVCRFDVKATAMEVSLDWDPPCDDGGASAPFPQYQVQFWRKDYGGNWNHLPDIPDGVTSYTHTFSREYFNQEFVFQVRAVNTVGFGEWTMKTVKMLEPIQCKGTSPTTGVSLACSGQGECHPYDGTCACDYEYAGNGCGKINGVKLTMSIEGTIETFDRTAFRTRVAEILGINEYRIPTKLITVEAGSVIVHFAILEERTSNATATTVTSTSALSTLQTKLTSGDLYDLGASSLRVDRSEGTVTGDSGGDGASSTATAPAFPDCSEALTTDDPCDECLLRPGCGYCGGPKSAQPEDTSTEKTDSSSSSSSSSSASSSTSSSSNDQSSEQSATKSGTCMMGGTFGPAVGTGTCPSSKGWYYGATTCPMTPRETCATHATCGTCMVENGVNCAWCASTGTCLSQVDDRSECPWGWVPDKCVAKCDKEKLITSTSGVMWLGSDREGSELMYQALSQCKWTLRPTLPKRSGYTSRSSSDNEFSVDITFDRVNLGGGDSLQVFDDSGNLLEEFVAGVDDRLPLKVLAASGVVVIFSSDEHSTGTGFFAKYEATPQAFWDVYVVIAMSTISMLTMVCCFCCWMRCKTDDPDEARPITNNMGMSLHTTERGASLANIQKFPKFHYTDDHVHIMKEIGQSETCTICLGDYEEAEQLRLLPCGHCFHAECVDAWLQINRICPMCKVDVYDLYLQQERQKVVNKKASKKAAKEAKKRLKKDKKLQKKRLPANIIPVDLGCGVGPIPNAAKFGGSSSNNSSGTGSTTTTTTASFDEYFIDTTLSPIEQFRMRSRRLLSVGGGTIPQTHAVALSVGESKTTLPEIEMAVLPRSRNVRRVPMSSVELVQQEENLFTRGSNFMVNPTAQLRNPQHTTRVPSQTTNVSLMAYQQQRNRSMSGDRPGPIMPLRLAPITGRQAQQNRRRRTTIAEDDTLLRQAF
jgi:hypothetical protein